MSSTRLSAALIALAMTGLCRGGAPETETPSTIAPDATLTMSGTVVAIGIGYEWGSGTLHYRGRSLTFRVRGLSVFDVATADVTADGEVFHLKTLSDFTGTYVEESAGAAFGAGRSVAMLRNEHGVRIKLISKVAGLRFHLATSGVKITLRPVA